MPWFFMVGRSGRRYRISRSIRTFIDGHAYTPDGDSGAGGGGGSGGGSGSGGATGGGSGAGGVAGGGDSGAAGAGGGGGSGDGGNRLSPDHADAIKARDRQKAINRAVAARAKDLGLGDMTVEDGADGPTVSFTNGETIKNAVHEAERLRIEKQKKAGNWDEREAELARAHKKSLDDTVASKDATLRAYEAWIDQQTVTNEIEAAARSAKVQAGAEKDLAQLLRGSIVSRRTIDEETGRLTVATEVVDAEGRRRTKDGRAMTVQEAVNEAIDARPYLRTLDRKGGPGAGGYGREGQNGGGRGLIPDKAAAANAADLAIGIRPAKTT